jgi:hypothetical protein
MRRLQNRQALLVAALVFGVIGTYLLANSNALTPTASLEAEDGTVSGSAGVVTSASASGGKAVKFGSGGTTCTVNAILVNSCRPWLGATAAWYTSGGSVMGSWQSEVLAHETRIGRQVDVAHDYSGPGDVLSTGEKYFVNRANTYLMLNWKPVTSAAGTKWADATGCGSATCNSVDTTSIKKMADSIRDDIGGKKIFLSVWAEPDDDISPGGSPGCVAAGSATTGAMGTTADYVNMWHHVRSVFNSEGVTNVVWVMNWMGYAGHNCDVNDLYPGNSYVDWIVWDPYEGSTKTLDQTGVGLFYGFLTSNTTSSRAYTSKPWGLNEWGAEVVGNKPGTYQVYGYMKAALDNGTYPNLKMFNVWDSHVASSTKNWQIGFAQLDSNNPPTLVADPNEQAAYNAFANDPRFTDAFYQ